MPIQMQHLFINLTFITFETKTTKTTKPVNSKENKRLKKHSFFSVKKQYNKSVRCILSWVWAGAGLSKFENEWKKNSKVNNTNGEATHIL